MSGPKRNPDKLNTIGVVVVGICGAVLVYVTIVALEAFYVNDTSEIQTLADYGGQELAVKSLRSDQVNRIAEYGTNPRPAAPKANEPGKPQTYRIPIDLAMKLVIEGAKADPAALIPAVGRSEKSTVMPIFGRPKLIPPPTPAPGASPAAAAPEATPAARALPAAPHVPSGARTGSGAGALETSAAPGPSGSPAGPMPDKARRRATAAGTATSVGSSAVPKPQAPKAGSAPAPPKGNGK